MGTIAQKLEAANNSKKAIKTAIEAKGVVVGSAPLRDYASKINSISGGGSPFDDFVDSKGYQKYREQAEGWLRRSYEITGGLREVVSEQFKGNRALVYIPDGTTLKAGTTTLGYCWQDCSSLQFLDLSNWDVGNVTALFSCWNGCTSLQFLDLSNWDVGNVGSLLYCWSNCQSLQSLDVSNWDVSNVTTLANCWSNCQSLQSLDVSKWNTNKVLTLQSCFNGCSSLKSLDLSTWDVSKVTNLQSCLQGCSSIQSLDLSTWDVSKVTNLASCWYNCFSLQSLDLSTWDVGNVTNLQSCWFNCPKLIDLKCFRNAKVSFSLTNSNLLTRESLLSVLQAPAIVTTTQTLSLHADTKVLITTAQSNVSAGTADELDTQIATEATNAINKGWTIA